MALTSTDVVNAAIQEIGDNQPPVTGTAPNFDNSAAGVAAAQLYTKCVQTVARSYGWDFARNNYNLVLSGNAAPVGWAFEYLYPTNGVQVRQLMPAAIADANDPRPVDWNVGNSAVGGVSVKVVWANLANAKALITNQPPESTWDPLFVESVVRLLASEMAMALEGRPDTARDQMAAFGQFEQAGAERDS